MATISDFIRNAPLDYIAGRESWDDPNKRPVATVLRSRPGESKSSQIENVLPNVMEQAFFADLDEYEMPPIPDILTGNHVHMSDGGHVWVITDTVSMRDAPDFKGFLIPKKDGTSAYTCPDLVTMERAAYQCGAKVVIMLMDEVMGADHLSQKALTDVFLNGRFGNFSLYPTTWVIGATNRQQDGAGVNRALSILTNRINQLDVELPMDEWVAYARDTLALPPLLLSFAKQFPGMCVVEQPPKEGPFPTFRSMTYVGEWVAAYKRSIGDTDEMSLPLDDGHDYAREKVAGFVGDVVANKLAGYARIASEVPRYEDVMADPKTAHVPPPERLDAAFAAGQMCIYYANAKNAATLFEYVMRLPAELQAAIGKQLIDKQDASPNVGNIRGALNTSPELHDVAAHACRRHRRRAQELTPTSAAPRRRAVTEAAMPKPTKETNRSHLSAGQANAEGMSLEEIAQQLGITRERVRQIERIALAKLALRARAKDLDPEDFINE